MCQCHSVMGQTLLLKMPHQHLGTCPWQWRVTFSQSEFPEHWGYLTHKWLLESQSSNSPWQTIAIMGICFFIPLWENLCSFIQIVLYGCSQLWICVEKCQCFNYFIMINENKTRDRWNIRWLLYSKSLVAIKGVLKSPLK